MSKCGGCLRTITKQDVKNGKVIGVLDSLWHRDHLKCCYCRTHLSEDQVYRSSFDRFQAACYNCYMMTTHPTCAGCFEPLMEKATQAMDLLYHQKCFKCALCRKVIPIGNGFYEKDDMIVDQKCYIMQCREKLL
ncbi:unnamed protein product [Caenorhabditis angaria]|uniref:LIM zinc-binding domain-containing protein n=1 Tax=Caenorhabditis angaria TaxID=860376 RepID=A0A9P1I794_9PELO|nr:unnamed protein product [Caenorhabditis angaria]